MSTDLLAAGEPEVHEPVCDREELFLAKGQTHALMLDHHRELVVAVSAGSLWVTVQGDPTDYVATADAPLVLRGSGLIVFEGIDEWNVFAGFR